MPRNLAPIAAALLAALLAGCTYERNGPVVNHFSDFRTQPPTKSTVTVCHAYGCKMQTRFRFTSADIAQLRKLMRSKKRKDTAAEERRAVAYAIGWIETRVGKAIGTSKDRPGMELNGPGDPTQLDCVDEATNTTSYMMVLANHDLIEHHTVGTPFSKGNVLVGGVANWPHWTGVLVEKKGGQRWAVDSWIYENGENPAIVETEKWYLDDLSSLPKPLS